MRKLFVSILVCLISLGSIAFAQTIYVDVNNTSGIEDGTAANPYNTVQEGINAAIEGDVVQVAPGTYSPATGEVFPIDIMSPVKTHDVRVKIVGNNNQDKGLYDGHGSTLQAISGHVTE